MSAQSKPIQSFQWTTPLDLDSVAARHGELANAIEKAKRSRRKSKRLEFHVSSPNDYLARQLLASARKSAEVSGIEISVICETGSWTNDPVELVTA